MNKKFIKTKRSFTKLRTYGWLFTLLVALGGLFQPKLGLLVLFIMAGLLVTSFFNGRYWCGNICTHGSLFDNIFLPFSKNKKIPEFFRSKYFIGGFLVFFMFNFSRKLLGVFSNWNSFDSLDKLGAIFSNTYLMVLILGGLLSIFITPRTWCQFCPMGTMQKASYGLSKKLGISPKTEKRLTMSDRSLCKECGLCEKVCPFQLSPYENLDPHNQFTDDDCIKCGTCVNKCPMKILSFENSKA